MSGNIYSGNKKKWQPAKPNPYVDIAFYPGKGTATFDFIDTNQDDKAVIFSAVSDPDQISLTIPPVSFSGKLKIYTDKKPGHLIRNGKTFKAVYKNNFIIIDRIAKENLIVDVFFK